MVFILKESDFDIKEDGKIRIYNKELLNNNVPGILLIHAKWCGHCTKFMPEYSNLSNLLGIKFMCASIEHAELEKNNALDKALNVQGFPTMKFFDKSGYIVADYPSERGRDLSTILEVICNYYHTCVRN